MKYAQGNLMKNLIAVIPGESLHFYCSVYSGAYEFRANLYDGVGAYVTHTAFDTGDFVWTVPDDVYYLWVSYPNQGDVSVTRVTAYDTINAQITAQAEQGGTNQ